MRKCKYRNCIEEIKGRSNKCYCDNKCQRNEKKYRYRLKNKLNNEEINK